ncbi:MAG TPA: CHAT domain-containing protein [Cyclobacteriaceae bacterium]
MKSSYFPAVLIIAFTFYAFTTCGQYQFKNDEARAVWEKLDQYYLDYNYRGILDLEDKALAIFEDKQDTLTASIYNMLGESYLYEINDPQKALNYYEKDYKLMSNLAPNSPEKIQSASNLAGLYDELGYYGFSEKIYLDNLNYFEEKKGLKSYEYLQTAQDLAIHYQYTGEFQKGIELLKPLLRKADKTMELYPMMLTSMGSLYFDQGSYKKAEKTFKEALKAYQDLGLYASLEYIGTINYLASLYNETGRLNLAEELSLEALDIVNRLQGDNTDIKSTVYYNIADQYTSFGNYDQAIEYLNEAIALDASYYGTNSFNYVVSLNLLGQVYDYKEDYDRAEEILEKALEITETNDELVFVKPAILNNLAIAYTGKGAYEEALKLLSESSLLMAELYGEDSEKYGAVLFRLGNLHLRIGNKDLASQFLNKSAKIRLNSIGAYHQKYAETLNKLAILEWSDHDDTEVVKLFRQIFEIYFNQVEKFFPVLSEEEKAKFYYNKVKYAFDQFNSYIVEVNNQYPELIGDMYDYQLATKGLILYATNKVRETILNSSDSLLIDKYSTWVSYKEQLSKLFSSTETNLEKRNQKIDSLTFLANRLEKELGRESSAFSEVYTKNRITWKDVRDKLKEGEAAVEIVRFRKFSPDSGGYFTGDVHYAALIVKPSTKKNPELVFIEDGKKMENRYLANYRNAIRYKVEESYSYNLFWRPIANNLNGISKIYFSPDGVYNQISIYTLQNSKTKNYTVDEVDIRVLTNTKDLVINNGKNKNNYKSKKAQFFGFPNYNMGNLEQMLAEREQALETAENIADAVSQGRGKRGTRGGTRGSRGSRSGEEGIADLLSDNREGGLSRGLRGNIQRYMSGNNLLALLPGTKKEVETIKDLYDNEELPYDMYMEDNAMENSIKEVKNPSTLHIATHGFFLENQETENNEAVDPYVENPLLRSGLILAGANSFLSTGSIGEGTTDGDDGILTAYEAMNLYLDDTDLVVLSACETGLGEVLNGEGVFGLQRAFQIAGAESLIMSMWSVDDAATQELMTAFYNEWLKTGDKHNAFKKAQKQIKEKWEAPYYWGAFVMVGN